MSFQTTSTPDQGLSVATKRMLLLVGTILLLEFFALLVAVLLAAFISWMFGESLNSYPWHSVIAVDFLIIIFSAVLAEHADGPVSETESASMSPRTMGIASFMISVGTLAPVATYAANIWRASSGGPAYQESFLSTLLCRQNEQSCHQTYFIIIVLIAGTSIVIALLTAHMLHRMVEGHNDDKWSAQGIAPLVASVFLFCVYTLFNPVWDVKSSELRTVSLGGYISVGGIVLAAAGVFCYLAVRVARAAGQAVRDTKRDVGTGRSGRAVFSWLATSAIWGLGLLLVKLVFEAATLSGWMGTGTWLRPIVELASFLLGFWLLSVAICSIGALIYALGWILKRFGKITHEIIDTCKLQLSTLTGKLSAVFGILQAIPHNLLEEVRERMGDLRRRRWMGRVRKYEEVVNGQEAVRSMPGPFRESVNPWATVEKPSEPSGEERATGEELYKETEVDGVSQGKSSIEGRTETGWTQTTWERCLFFGGCLIEATRVLGGRIAPAGLLLRLLVALSLLPPISYTLVERPERPKAPEVKLVIQKDPERIVSEPEAPTLPAKQLMFENARLVCSSHQVLAWSYGEIDQLYSPVSSCRFEENSLAPCNSGAMVVVGRASSGGTGEIEARRSLKRGQLLASVLQRDYMRQCGGKSEMRWYVLSLGPYVSGSLRRDGARQREVLVLKGEGDAHLPSIISALEQYAGQQPLLAEYSTCDLHALNWPSKTSSLLSRVHCAQAIPRSDR